MSGYGIVTQGHTLAQLKLQTGLTVLEYGEQNMYANVEAYVQAVNREAARLVEPYCEVTNQRAILYGGDGSVEIEELGSVGRSQGETFQSTAIAGFPIRRFGKQLAWTRDALEMTTVAEFAAWTKAILLADKRNIVKRIKNAIYNPVSYDFYDVLFDNALLKVKAAAYNGDGAIISPGPHGLPFDGSTHVHYLARAGGAFASGDVDRQIATLLEHQEDATIKIEIDQSQLAAFRTFTDFEPTVYSTTVPGANAHYSNIATLDPVKVTDRVVGTYQGFEVAVRFTAIPNYVIARLEGASIRKPLAIRVRGVGAGNLGGALNSILAGGTGGSGTGGAGFGDLKLVADWEDYPLRAKEWHREFDVAGNPDGRGSIAILYTADTTYAAPVIN